MRPTLKCYVLRCSAQTGFAPYNLEPAAWEIRANLRHCTILCTMHFIYQPVSHYIALSQTFIMYMHLESNESIASQIINGHYVGNTGAAASAAATATGAASAAASASGVSASAVAGAGDAAAAAASSGTSAAAAAAAAAASGASQPPPVPSVLSYPRASILPVDYKRILLKVFASSNIVL